MAEPLQVYIVHEPMIRAFRQWVRDQGWHLQGPFTYEEGDTPTVFLQPMPSEEALGDFLRGC